MFVAVLSLVSAYVIVNNLYDTYTRMLESNVKQAALDTESYFQSVTNFTKSTAQRKEIVEALTLGKTENVSRVLNTLCNSSAEIAGAILYGVDGRTFYSTGVGDVPTFAEMFNATKLQSFFDGEAVSCVSIRNSAMPKVYNTYPYDENNGIVSCVCKVYAGDNVVGYLFADIFPSQLFANKLAIGYDGFNAIIISGDVVIAQDGGASAASMRAGLQYFSVTTSFNGSDSLKVFVSSGEFCLRCAIVIGVLVLADVLCLFVMWKVAKRIANRITVPLDNLRIQMQNGLL